MKILAGILSFIILSCNFTTEKEQTFIAINLEKVNEDLKEKHKNLPTDQIPPPPPVVYYSKHNIIIDDEGSLYYFLRSDKVNHSCFTGWHSKKPEFLKLKPSELIKVPEDSIKSFVNKVRPEYGKLFISFSSVKDTFKSQSLSKLINFYDRDRSLTAYTLRVATAEEKVVLEHKKSGIPYDPKKIKWTTANFDPGTLPTQ